jgi:ABC-2 type transport system permease protein
MIPITLHIGFHRALRFFDSHRVAKLITIGLFGAAFFFLAWEVHLLSWRGFMIIERDPFFATAVTTMFIELFVGIAMFFVAASGAIGALSSLGKGEARDLLIVSPKFRLIAIPAIVRTIMTATIPILGLLSPVLLAWDRVFSVTLVGAVVSMLAVFLSVGIAAFLGHGVVLLVGFMVRGLASRWHSRRVVAVGSAIVLLLVGMVSWSAFRRADLVTVFASRDLAAPRADEGPVAQLFTMSIGHPGALVVLHAIGPQPEDRWAPLLGLLGFGVVVVGSVTILARSALPLEQMLREGEGVSSHGRTGKIFPLLARAESPRAALFAKETLVFLRDPKGMMWLGFILAIWVLQVASSQVLFRGLREERIATANAVGAIEGIALAIVIYFASLIALRFVFPAFSSERRAAWIIGSAPAERAGVFLSKFVFFSVVIGGLSALFGTFMLVPAGAMSVFFLAASMLGGATVTMLALTISLWFPNRETDDPDLLSTSLPGLGFVFVAVGYGVLAAMALGVSPSGIETAHVQSPFLVIVIASLVAIVALASIATLRLRAPRLD